MKFFLLLLLGMALALHGKNPVVAITDFESRGIEKSITDLFVEKLGSDLSSNMLLNVIVHSNIKSVLKDIGLEKKNCQADSCFIKAARMMEITHIVMGVIEKNESNIQVNVRIIYADSNKAEALEPTHCQNCDSRDILLTASATVSAKISEKIQDINLLEQKMKGQNSVSVPVAKKPDSNERSGKVWVYTGAATVAVGSAAILVWMNRPRTRVEEKSSGTLKIQ